MKVVVQEAYALNDPMLVVHGISDLGYESFVRFDNDQIELDAVKKSEDGDYIVIRFHEFAGSAQNVTVYPGFHFKSWVECDLRERPVGSVSQEKKYIFQCMLMKLRLFWFNYKEISTSG